MKLLPNSYSLVPAFRGVSSTAKLSVSKTELGGSNPSAPARFVRMCAADAGHEGMEVWQLNQQSRRATIIPPDGRSRARYRLSLATRWAYGADSRASCPMF